MNSLPPLPLLPGLPGRGDDGAGALRALRRNRRAGRRTRRSVARGPGHSALSDADEAQPVVVILAYIARGGGGTVNPNFSMIILRIMNVQLLGPF